MALCSIDESAKNIGIHHYYPQVRKALGNILKLLDSQIGKTMMMTKTENKDKDVDDLITSVSLTKLMTLLHYDVYDMSRLIPFSDRNNCNHILIASHLIFQLVVFCPDVANMAVENLLKCSW